MLFCRAEGEDQTRVSLNCSEKAMQDVVALLSQNGLYHKTEILLLQKVINFTAVPPFTELPVMFVKSARLMALESKTAYPQNKKSIGSNVSFLMLPFLRFPYHWHWGTWEHLCFAKEVGLIVWPVLPLNLFVVSSADRFNGLSCPFNVLRST